MTWHREQTEGGQTNHIRLGNIGSIIVWFTSQTLFEIGHVIALTFVRSIIIQFTRPNAVKTDIITRILGDLVNSISIYIVSIHPVTIFIAGFTPEAPTLEAAFGGNSIKKTITITQEDIEAVRKRLCGEPGKIDFAMFGCPHFTISQIETVAKVVEGKKAAVPIWILTGASTKELSGRMGFTDIIQRAGGHVISDTCIDVPPCWYPYYGKTGVTDSPKCAYYYEIRKTTFIIRPLEESIEAAIRGEVTA